MFLMDQLYVFHPVDKQNCLLYGIMMGLNDRYDYEFQYVIFDYSMDYSIE